MENNVKESGTATPMLFPIAPEIFWQKLRLLVREEVINSQPAIPVQNEYVTPGLTVKPLYKIHEVCKLFQVSKPTVYDWINSGTLRRYKIRSRVFFLWEDLQKLLKGKE